MSRAFVFPGQGAQTIGMGRALAEAYPAAKAVFDEVDTALGEKLSAIIWEGDIAELTLTQNAQPALMATSIAPSLFSANQVWMNSTQLGSRMQTCSCWRTPKSASPCASRFTAALTCANDIAGPASVQDRKGRPGRSRA